MALDRRVPSAQDLHRAYSLSHEPRSVRRRWILATTLGEMLAFLTPAFVGSVAYDWHAELFFVVMVAAGLVEGAVLGAAQSLVLAREFLGFSRSAWAVVTALGAGAAWFLGMLPSTTYPLWQDWSPAVLLPLGLVMGLALVSSIGFAQWLVLRRHVARSRTWVPVNALAWLVGLGLLFAVATPLWREGQSTAVVIGIGAVGAFVMALTVAVVTGLWLARLVHPRTSSGPRPTPLGVPVSEWDTLAQPTDRFEVFDPSMLEDLPEPVRRWLGHVITPGAPLLTGFDVEGTGHIRLRGTWRPLYVRHRATMHGGFIWAARTRLAGMAATGFDRFTGDRGEMRWWVMRRVRMISQTGEEVTRSAAGRHAAELLSVAPAVALHPSVSWEPVDHQRAVAHLVVGGDSQAVTVRVDALGRLRQVEMDRWGAPPGFTFDRYRFGALLTEERAFDGYLVPTEVVGGWHIGTGRWDDGVFLRYRLLRCTFH